MLKPGHNLLTDSPPELGDAVNKGHGNNLVLQKGRRT